MSSLPSTENRWRQQQTCRTKVNRYRPGDKLEVTYLRKGKEDKKTVVLRNIAGTTGVVAPGTTSTDIFGATFAPVTATRT